MLEIIRYSKGNGKGSLMYKKPHQILSYADNAREIIDTSYRMGVE